MARAYCASPFRAGSSTGPSDRWLRWRLSASRPSTCSASETGTRWQSCAGAWTISVRSSIRFRRESRRCAARSLPGGRCTPRCGRRSVRRRARIRGEPGSVVPLPMPCARNRVAVAVNSSSGTRRPCSSSVVPPYERSVRASDASIESKMSVSRRTLPSASGATCSSAKGARNASIGWTAARTNAALRKGV